MKRLMKQVRKLVVLMALCCAMLAGNLIIPAGTAQAATKKAAVSETQMTIPVGKLSSKAYWNTSSWEISNAKKLAVKNAVKGATYQFTSGNTKIVKVDKAGGYLTGVKAGSATITCTQSYKGKKTTVGKCKVTVKKAGLTISDDSLDAPVGSGKFDLEDYFIGNEPLFQITYRNPGATYSVTSSSKDFTIKMVKYDASTAKKSSGSKDYQTELKNYIGKKYSYGYQYTAKKAGNYTVTIKETYNKKTTKLGSFKVSIKDTCVVEGEQELLLGRDMDPGYLINYMKKDTAYYFHINNYDEANPENNVVVQKMDENIDAPFLYGNKVGTATVTFTEGSLDGPVIGTVTIVVKEAPCQSISLDSEEYSTYVGDEYFSIYYELDPYDTTDKVMIETDIADVLKVEYVEEDGYWAYTPVKAGTANVTIKCGSQSATCKVTVED